MFRSRQVRPALRNGFTRVELLTTLGVLLLSCLVLAPALLQQRRRARPLECLSNMRNVAIATLNYASSNDGALPPLTTDLKVGSSTEQVHLRVGWPILLLPGLDNTALLRKIRENAVIKPGQLQIGPQERVKVVVFTCWDDAISADRPGGLSFVMNTGFIAEELYQGDPDGRHVPGTLAWRGTPGDPNAVGIHLATGAMWVPSHGFGGSLEYVSRGDGTTSTLLITENLQAGDWFDTDTARIGFGFPVANTKGQVALGPGQIFDSIEKPLNTQFEGATFETLKVKNWRINHDLKAKVGTLPRPSSNHQGGANVMMCDGSGKFLNQNIDPHVYLKLLTSNGVTYGEGELKQSDYLKW